MLNQNQLIVKLRRQAFKIHTKHTFCPLTLHTECAIINANLSSGSMPEADAKEEKHERHRQ